MKEKLAALDTSAVAAAPALPAIPDNTAPLRPIVAPPATATTAIPAAATPVTVTVATGPASGTTSSGPNSTNLPAPTALAAPETTVSGSAAQSARLVQGVAQSEMHIGLRTPAFGSVEVHTAIRDSQLGLAVSSERGDLRGYLAQEVPGLQNVFHQQGLQFDQIRFTTPGNGTGSNFSAGSNSHSNSSENGRNPKTWDAPAAAPQTTQPLCEAESTPARLNVLV